MLPLRNEVIRLVCLNETQGILTAATQMLIMLFEMIDYKSLLLN